MKKPNIVFFLVDDMGWGDIGCYGNRFHETPAIDKLCDEGVKFTQAYSSCTVCSPSRAALLTGQYPARLHLTDWIAGHNYPWAKLKVPDWKMEIDHERQTLPKTLKKEGYNTHFIGKWHLMPHLDRDRMYDYLPEKQGFDTNVGGCEWGQPKGRGKYFHPFDVPGLEGKEGDFLTDKLTDEAVKIIEKAGDKPFFLYLSFYLLHSPLMTKPEYLEKYRNKAKDMGLDLEERHLNYAGMAQSMDESVARITEALKDQGLDEDTIIVYTADNGGDNVDNNGGLRERKATAYEGGTRVCQIMRWKNKIEAGKVIEDPVIHTDLYPTLLDLADIPAVPQEHLDGKSLLPEIHNNEKNEDRDLFWHYPHYHRTKPYSAIRSGDMKLIEFLEDSSVELYDLANDFSESKDLSVSQPETVAKLREKLNQWRISVDAQMMDLNPNYDPQKANKSTGEKPKSPTFYTE